MNAVIINSAPGVGKTTLLKLLENRLITSCAVIDGDDVGRLIPMKNSIVWLNLIQDNIAACAENFKEYKIKTLLVSFVFPAEERLQRMTNLLEGIGYTVYHLSLTCESAVLENRLKTRNTQKIVSIKSALQHNKDIKKLQADFSIDTTLKSPDQVGKIAVEIVERLANRKEKKDD